jgi:hypothetical protein
MPTQLPGTLAYHDDREAEHDVMPGFAWAIVGGSVDLAACALLLALSVTWGGLLPSASMPDGSVAVIPTYSSSLAGTFMAGFLVVLVARSLSARTH